jgi:hypothetical protein
MSRYRSALLALAILWGVFIALPFLWAFQRDFRTELAKTDAAESWAEIVTNLTMAAHQIGGPPAAAQAAAPTPMRFADFVGTWHRHGYSLTIYPDGSAVAAWRTYDGDLPEAPGGNATLRFDRVEGRTLYGTNPNSATRQSVALTEYDYGVGFLTDDPAVVASNAPFDPQRGTTLCGPRFATAPEWFTGTSPCGA